MNVYVGWLDRNRFQTSTQIVCMWDNVNVTSTELVPAWNQISYTYSR